MTFCVDKIWDLFKKHVSDDKVRFVFGQELIDISDYEDKGFNPYCSELMYYLAERDDGRFLDLHCSNADTIEGVVKAIDFQIRHNGIAAERRDGLMKLWMKQSGVYSSEEETLLLTKERELLKARIEKINDEIDTLEKE